MPNSKYLDELGISLVSSKTRYPEQHQSDASIPLVEAKTPFCTLLFALQGAQIISFIPEGQKDWLWLSPRSAFLPNTPIRGGIPLCLPWFGADPSGSPMMHGFARLSEWSLSEAETTPEGALRLLLQLGSDRSRSESWEHAFRFSLEIIAKDDLKLSLTAENLSSKPAPLSFAYHTYFAVSDVEAVSVMGLSDTSYIDKTDQMTRKTQTGPMTFKGQTDRIYLDVPATQILNTGDTKRAITSPSKCAILWNAGEKAKDIPDIGEGRHKGYVCLERGDVADFAKTLLPKVPYVCEMQIR